MKLQLIVSIVVLSKFCTVYGVTVEDYKNLQKHLLTNYSNKVRPVKNQDHTVQLTASFILSDINDVDAVQQRLVTTVYLNIFWFDELLVWDNQIINVDRLYFKQVSRMCFTNDVRPSFTYVDKNVNIFWVDLCMPKTDQNGFWKIHKQ